MECPRCEGSGKCSECGGQGFIVCLNCEGSGESSSSRGARYPCRVCKGSGKIDCSLECASCAGTGQITSELQEAVRDKYHVRWDTQLPLYRFTNVLVFLFVLLFVLEQANPTAKAWLETHWSNLSGEWNEPWRLLTSGFLHAGLWHLAGNSLALLRYGPLLEGLYGSARYVFLWFLCVLGGSVLSCWAHPALQGEIVFSLGASGGVYGLWGAMLGLHHRYALLDRVQMRETFVSLAVWTLAYAALLNTDNWAHVGGFLTGFAYVWVTRRPAGR